MERRGFLKAGLAAACAGASAAGTRPHLLILMSDQHRGDWTHAAGNAALITPHMDRLAAGGIRFRHAYSSTPTCTPARSALLTGMSPWKHGLLGYGAVAPTLPVELPRLLRDAGYYTCGIGKMHYHSQRAAHGFQQLLLDESGREESPDFRSDYRSWFYSEAPTLNPDATGIDWNGYDAKPYALPERLHPTAWIGDTAVRFLEEYQKPEPFFLKVSFERPHSPYDPPRRWWDRYEKAALPQANVGAWAAGYAPRSDAGPAPWHGDLGKDQVRLSRQGYAGSVSFVDEQFGRILDALKKRGWLENTLVVFLADHGDMLGDHNLWRKSYAYEGSARIPMIIHWPAKIRGGQVAEHPVEIRDVLPTLLEAAGVAIPAAVDGKSLLRIASDPKAPWREWIDLEHDVCYAAENHWNALTDGKKKYIFHAMTGQEQLFDLAADPGELRDLSAESTWTAELALWRGRMVKELESRGPAWVKDGKLQLRVKSQLHSPNYPV